MPYHRDTTHGLVRSAACSLQANSVAPRRCCAPGGGRDGCHAAAHGRDHGVGGSERPPFYRANGRPAGRGPKSNDARQSRSRQSRDHRPTPTPLPSGTPAYHPPPPLGDSTRTFSRMCRNARGGRRPPQRPPPPQSPLPTRPVHRGRRCARRGSPLRPAPATARAVQMQKSRWQTGSPPSLRGRRCRRRPHHRRPSCSRGGPPPTLSVGHAGAGRGVKAAGPSVRLTGTPPPPPPSPQEGGGQTGSGGGQCPVPPTAKTDLKRTLTLGHRHRQHRHHQHRHRHRGAALV